MAELEFTNKLLKEAIADAEAVRQTAIENAKLSLEETFTPQIKSMLERKLRAEAEGMGEEEMEEATELPLEDGEPEGSSEMPADSSDIGAGDNKEPSPEAFDSAEDDMSGEGHTDSSTDWYEDWTDSDFDLDEVIKELEEDVKLLEGEGEEKEEEKEDEKEEEKEEESEAEGEEDEDKGEYPEGEPAGVEGDEPPADSSDIGEKDAAKFTLDEFLSMMQEAGYDVHEMGFDKVLPAAEPPMEEEGVKDFARGAAKLVGTGIEAARQGKLGKMVRTVGQEMAPKVKAAGGGLKGVASAVSDIGADSDVGYRNKDDVAKLEEEDLNLEEILAMLEAEDAGEPESEEMASEVQALQEELAEYRKAVDILRGKLHEVNLLNAKLLYTNKIFRKEGLTNEQKVTIVENFDRATTIREVKMVYAVLAESLVPQKSAKTTAGAKKIVAEGLASKPTPSTAPKTEAPEVIAENSVAKRLQQLAGIIS